MGRSNLFLAFLFITLLPLSLFAQELLWHKQKSGVNTSLRGLHVVNDSVVWASGAAGTLLLTTNAGESWQQLSPPDSLDFRSLWAFNEKEAFIASAGQPARLYFTKNGGLNWQLVLQDSTGKAFYDAISFWDASNGLLLSDPVDGKILLLKTRDGGQSWHALAPPAPKAGEAFFAASNGSIALAGSAKAWIGTGGSAVRVLVSPDGGKSWQTQDVPMPLYSEAAGIYALVFADQSLGVAVGGAYDQAAQGKYAAYYTTNGGKKWQPATQPPKGYRSGVAHMPKSKTFVAVGTNGTDISTNGGKSWQMINEENLNSIRFSPGGTKGWAIGPKGAIFKIDVKP